MSVKQRFRWLLLAVTLSAAATLGSFALDSSAAARGSERVAVGAAPGAPAPLPTSPSRSSPDLQEAPRSAGPASSAPAFRTGSGSEVAPPSAPLPEDLEPARLAQGDNPGPTDLLESLGMHENEGESVPVPGLQEVAMAEFAPMFSSLGLSEAAAGGLAGPILGGTAAAGAVAGTVTALTDVRSIALGPPVSR